MKVIENLYRAVYFVQPREERRLNLEKGFGKYATGNCGTAECRQKYPF